MARPTGLSEWLPGIATGLAFVAAVGGTALAGSSMLADLVGLVFLLASPAIYRGLQAVFGPREVTARSWTGTAA